MPGRELGHLALEVEVEILDLSFGKLVGKLAEHAGNVEVGRVRARHDLVDADLQHVTGLGALDVYRARERVRSASREVRAQFLDLLDRRAGHDLVVRVHHRLEHDGVAGIDVQHGRLRIVEPAPLRRFHRRGQEMRLAAQAFGRHEPQLLLVGRRRRNRRHDGGCGSRRSRRASRWCGGLLREDDRGCDRDSRTDDHGARAGAGIRTC